MEDQVAKAMVRGIDESAVVVIFVTKTYMVKVNGDDPRDNCQLEFQYAMKALPGKFICVVMEEAMRSTNTWKGEFGMFTKNPLFIDMSEDVVGDARTKALDKLVAQVKKMMA
jgi:hypothetical protein